MQSEYRAKEAESAKQRQLKRKQAEEEDGFQRSGRRTLSAVQYEIVHTAFAKIRPDQLTGSGLLSTRAIVEMAQANKKFRAVFDDLRSELGHIKAMSAIKSSLKSESQKAKRSESEPQSPVSIKIKKRKN